MRVGERIMSVSDTYIIPCGLSKHGLTHALLNKMNHISKEEVLEVSITDFENIFWLM